MSTEIDAYKQFIDGLVNYRGSVTYISNAFQEKEWNHSSSRLLDALPDEIREEIASVIRKTARAAIHDVLVYLTDNNYSLSREGLTLPDRPMDATLYEDFTARLDGMPWPEEEE